MSGIGAVTRIQKKTNKPSLFRPIFIKRMGRQREMFRCPLGHCQAGVMPQLGNQALPSWSGRALLENTCSLFQGSDFGVAGSSCQNNSIHSHRDLSQQNWGKGANKPRSHRKYGHGEFLNSFWRRE